MKRLVFLLVTCMIMGVINAQVGINTDNSAPDPSAGLDVKFSNKGVLYSERDKFRQSNCLRSKSNKILFK